MKTKDTKRKTRTGAARRIGALLLALTMTFGTWTPAFAEEPAPVIEEHAVEETPVNEENKEVTPEVQETPVQDKADGLEIGPEIVQEGVGEPETDSKLNPTVNTPKVGENEVSGKGLQKDIKAKPPKVGTIHVLVKDADGVPKGEEKTFVGKTKNNSRAWNVTLDQNLAKGDKIQVWQVYDGKRSETITVEPELSLADKYKDDLKMPEGEIWIEQTNSNIVNKDEQKEALRMLKEANPDIAKHIISVELKINGTTSASFAKINYDDKSIARDVPAPNLKVKQVTETSADPTIEKVRLADNEIKVTLAKEVAPGTKFYFAKTIDKQEYNNFCPGGNCVTEKTDATEMTQAVTVHGNTVTFSVGDKDLELGKEFGIVVKEPHKFRSCAKSEPVLGTPNKVGVRDPHKLTAADKTAIDEAIRKANTTKSGVSKMPDGTGTDVGGVPAFIEFDKDGNVRIISPNNVVISDWVNDTPIFDKNSDGTYKVTDESKVIKMEAKDLILNKKPEPPTIAVDTDKGEVTITPPAYKDPGDDTDLASYELTYKDASGAEKTVTATRDLKTNKWTGTGVNEETGVITLDVKDLEVGGTLTATAKDNGGLEGDTEKLESAPATKTLETATVTYDKNGGKGDMVAKKVNKGSKHILPANGFKAPDDTQEFDTWEVGGKRVAPNTDIKVDKDTEVKALWKKIQVTVTFNMNGHGTAPANQKIKKGETATKPTKPTAEGWTFEGWYTDEALKSEYDFTKPVTESFTLFAKWTQDNNGGNTPGGGDNTPGGGDNTPGGGDNTPGGGDNTPGGGDNTPGSGENTPGGTNPGTKPGDKPNPNNPSVSNPDEQIIITVDPNGGNWNGETSIRRYPEKIGSIFTLDEAPKRDGYTFVYWQGSVYQPGDKYTVKGSHTFTAVWIKDGETTDARLRRFLALTGEKKITVPKAGVGAATSSVEPMLFPVDLLPAPKKREEE